MNPYKYHEKYPPSDMSKQSTKIKSRKGRSQQVAKVRTVTFCNFVDD